MRIAHVAPLYERVPSALYRPVDGDWAKWNVEAILHFGKPFDLGPYSMLAGMGSRFTLMVAVSVQPESADATRVTV